MILNLYETIIIIIALSLITIDITIDKVMW